MALFAAGNEYPELRWQPGLIPSDMLLLPNNLLTHDNPQTRALYSDYCLRGRCYTRKRKRVPTKADDHYALLERVRSNPMVVTLFRKKIQRYRNRVDPVAGQVSLMYSKFLDHLAAGSTTAPKPEHITIKHSTKRTVLASMWNFKWKGFDDFVAKMVKVHLQIPHAYKVNLAFSYVLIDQSGPIPEFRTFYGRDNNTILDAPAVVTSTTDLKTRVTEVLRTSRPPEEFYKMFRPESRWKFHKLLDFVVYVYRIPRIGCPGMELKSNRFVHHFSGYNDRLCFFRCLAVTLHGCASHRCTEAARELASEVGSPATQGCGGSRQGGVRLDELRSFENRFQLGIYVYGENRDLIRGPKVFCDRSMHLLLTSSKDHGCHFSLITDIAHWLGQHECGKCHKFFKSARYRNVHARKCQKQQSTPPRGSLHYTKPKTAKEAVRAAFPTAAVPSVYPFFAVFDCESVLIRESAGRRRHALISISISSNVPGYAHHTVTQLKVGGLEDTVCFVADEDTENAARDLVDKFVAHLLYLQSLARLVMRQRYSDTLRQLAATAFENPAMSKVYHDFQRYLDVLPVIGYNSSMYDVNLLKRFLFDALIRRRSSDRGVRVIKKGNRYQVVSTDELVFLDLIHYVTPHTSLDQYCRMWLGKSVKLPFPYEWFDSFDKLDIPMSRIPMSHFPMSQSQIPMSHFPMSQLKTFRDYLVLYNKADTQPLVQAIQMHMGFLETLGLDMFKDGVTLPGLVERYLFRDLQRQGTVLSLVEPEILRLFRDQIVAGPSIVFTHYARRGLTFIRNNPSQVCEKIVGYDANSLYLWCMGQELPCRDHRVCHGMTVDQVRERLGSFCGFVLCDLRTPEALQGMMDEFPCVFRKAKVGKQTKIVSDFHGDRILVYTLLQWYLAHGLQLTAVHLVVEFLDPRRVFGEYVDMVADTRRKSQNPAHGAMIKLFGNSGYGRFLMDHSKFRQVSFCDEDKVEAEIARPAFRKLDPLGSGVFEVAKAPRRVFHNIPVQIGLAVYALAKLRMLEFYYDFARTYLDPSRFELCHMDTDSFYMAIAGESLDAIAVHPDYLQVRDQYLDKSRPGAFKLEFEGTDCVELASKTYCVRDHRTQVSKVSSKGVNKKGLDFESFVHVYANKTPLQSSTTQFVVQQSKVYTIQSLKKGLAFLNDKRNLCPDGRTTHCLSYPLSNSLPVPNSPETPPKLPELPRPIAQTTRTPPDKYGKGHRR